MRSEIDVVWGEVNGYSDKGFYWKLCKISCKMNDGRVVVGRD